jgi:ComF family protein
LRFSVVRRARLPNWVVSASKKLAQGSFAALFPSDCRLCGASLLNISRLPVCESCLQAMEPLAGGTCDICRERLPALNRLADAQTCTACEKARPHFAKAVAYGSYEHGLRGLIHLLKYEGVPPAAPVLGNMLARAIEKLGLGREQLLVVPVPLHAWKRREREFNQSELIACAALKKLTNPQLELAPKVLARMRPTVSQIGLTRPQRRENMRGAFQVVHPTKVAGRSILLVDDVLTTGTTAPECVRVLLKAGAKSVYVATVARTLKVSDSILQPGPEFEAAARAS